MNPRLASASLVLLLACTNAATDDGTDAGNGNDGGASSPDANGTTDATSAQPDGGPPVVTDGGSATDAKPPPAPAIPFGPWKAINLAQTGAYSIDLTAKDYPVWVPSPANHLYRATGGWDGGPSARIYPPTQAQTACGLGGWDNLWRNGTFAIKKLNVRFELLFGPSLTTRWHGADWKFFIAHTSPTLINAPDPGGGERPMANFAWHSGNMLGFAVGAGTVKNFNRSPPYAPSYWPSDDADFFMGAANGTYNGHPIVGPMTWVSVELEIISEATSQAPAGRIRAVLTRRDGTQLTDLSIPWTYDSNWTLNKYIATVQLIGGYWNDATSAAAADNYYEIADRITFAANRPGLLGPREGFVTQ